MTQPKRVADNPLIQRVYRHASISVLFDASPTYQGPAVQVHAWQGTQPVVQREAAEPGAAGWPQPVAAQAQSATYPPAGYPPAAADAVLQLPQAEAAEPRAVVSPPPVVAAQPRMPVALPPAAPPVIQAAGSTPESGSAPPQSAPPTGDDPIWRRLQTIYRRHQQRTAVESIASPESSTPAVQPGIATPALAAQETSVQASQALRSAPTTFPTLAAGEIAAHQPGHIEGTTALHAVAARPATVQASATPSPAAHDPEILLPGKGPPGAAGQAVGATFVAGDQAPAADAAAGVPSPVVHQQRDVHPSPLEGEIVTPALPLVGIPAPAPPALQRRDEPAAHAPAGEDAVGHAPAMPSSGAIDPAFAGRPVAPLPPIDAAAHAQGAVLQPPGASATPDAIPLQPAPLESAWPVQRRSDPPPVSTPGDLARGATHQPQALGKSDAAAVQSLMRAQPTAQPTFSAIELLPPRTPRPTLPRSEPAEAELAPSPPALPGAAAPGLEAPLRAVPPVAPAPVMVDTAIGVLPGDLWELLGQVPPVPPAQVPPPGVAGAAVAPDAAGRTTAQAGGSGEAGHAGAPPWPTAAAGSPPGGERSASSPTPMSVAQRSAMAAPETAETVRAVAALTPGAGSHRRGPSAAPEPGVALPVDNAPLAPARAEAQGAVRDLARAGQVSAPGGALQRAAAGEETAAAPPATAETVVPSATAETVVPSERPIDIDTLASEVFALLRRRLSVEWERLRVR